MVSSSSSAKKENLFLLTGENDYDLKQFLLKWICSSLEKYGEYNVVRYDFEEKSVTELLGELNTPPFFGNGKRIFFLENFPPPPPSRPFSEAAKKKILTLQDALLSLSDETVMVMAVSKPDKRTGVYKKIFSAAAKVYDFPAWTKDFSGMLSSDGVKAATEWVLEQVALNSGKILPAAARFLVEFCEAYPWTLSNEIEKLVTYSKSSERPISEQDIQNLCHPSDEMMNFAFSNAMQSGRKTEIFGVLSRLFSSGESPQAIFGRDLVPTIRQLLQVRFAIDSGAGAKDAGVHPFVYGKLKGIAEKLPTQALKKTHSELLRIDIESKTGFLSATSEKNEVFRLQVEKVILSLFETRLE